MGSECECLLEELTRFREIARSCPAICQSMQGFAQESFVFGCGLFQIARQLSICGCVEVLLKQIGASRFCALPGEHVITSQQRQD